MKAFGVFEGGGAKGYAHVGAFQAIEGRRMELAAVAFSRTGDPSIGDFQDAVVLAQFGDVDLNALSE
jgi:predicted acylesterase/phospholipase RssA